MTLKSSPNLSLRHPPYAALLTVSKEFDPLFSRRTETLEPVAVMMGLGAEQRLRRRWTPPPPPRQAPALLAVGQLSRHLRPAGGVRTCAQHASASSILFRPPWPSSGWGLGRPGEGGNLGLPENGHCGPRRGPAHGLEESDHPVPIPASATPPRGRCLTPRRRELVPGTALARAPPSARS